jgi:hypothetical protein
MTNISRRFATLGVALLALTASCSDTILEPGFGEGCLRGSLSAGQTVTGAFSPASCRMTYHFYSGYNSPYESWSVHLDAGKAYMFYMEQAPDPEQEDSNNVDPVLVLYGTDGQGRSVPLAASDDEGGGIDGHNSEFWFIAPRSGDFTVVAASYDWEEFGGYRLSMQSCPVLGTMDTAGTYTFHGRSSSCIRHDHSDYEDTPLAYTFVRVNVDSFETVDVEFHHNASMPIYEMGGPGLDTYDNIYEESENDYGYGDGSTGSITTDEIGGIVTVAMATEYFNAAGDWDLTLSRTIVTAPAWGAWRDGQPTMRSTFLKPEAKRKGTP